MNTSDFAIAVGAAMLATSPVFAAPPKEWAEYGVEARIAFPHSGGIRDYEANEDRGIWIQDRQRRWYYAKISGRCNGLSFAEAVSFDARGTSTFDRFGAIYAGGQYCPLESLVTAEKPLPRKERLKQRRQVREEGKKAVAPAD